MPPLASIDAPPQTDCDVDIRRQLLPPYKVIPHYDDHASMDHVVEALLKSVPGMSLERAGAIMWEAHTSGKAVVITCCLELDGLSPQRTALVRADSEVKQRRD